MRGYIKAGNHASIAIPSIPCSFFTLTNTKSFLSLNLPKMCHHADSPMIWRACPAQQQHSLIKRYIKKCATAETSGVICHNTTPNPNLGPFGTTTRPGQCPLCRDSGICVTTVYETVGHFLFSFMFHSADRERSLCEGGSCLRMLLDWQDKHERREVFWMWQRDLIGFIYY